MDTQKPVEGKACSFDVELIFLWMSWAQVGKLLTICDILNISPPVYSDSAYQKHNQSVNQQESHGRKIEHWFGWSTM